MTKEVDDAIKAYWAIPAKLEKLKYLRELPNVLLSGMGQEDLNICEEMAAFNESPEGLAYWEEQRSVKRS